MGRVLRVALKILAVILAPAILFELLLVLTDLDLRVIGTYVYRNEGNECYEGVPRLYRRSEDPERIYELVPGTKAVCVGCTHPLETKYQRAEVSINGLGFRGREFPAEKAPGVFRVFILGGSNTFGMSVGDDDTYPARIQARLESLGYGNVEIWNAGVNAYVISQKIAYLEEIVRRYAPDLVLIQDHNIGWRPLLRGPDDILAALRANETLVLEALPAAWGEPEAPHPVHEWLVRHWRTWRAAYGVFVYARLRASCDAGGQELSGCLTEDWRARFRAVSQRHSVAAFEAFMSRTELPVILVDTTDNRYCPGSLDHDRLRGVPSVRFYSFCDDSRPEEYYHVHPPGYVYEWYAARLVDDLILPALRELPAS
ncbi:MAG: hypothetical protein ABIK09_12440 [Pseudomonadota bacterium]